MEWSGNSTTHLYRRGFTAPGKLGKVGGEVGGISGRHLYLAHYSSPEPLVVAGSQLVTPVLAMGYREFPKYFPKFLDNFPGGCYNGCIKE